MSTISWTFAGEIAIILVNFFGKGYDLKLNVLLNLFFFTVMLFLTVMNMHK